MNTNISTSDVETYFFFFFVLVITKDICYKFGCIFRRWPETSLSHHYLITNAECSASGSIFNKSETIR